jgi:hypothetical protein
MLYYLAIVLVWGSSLTEMITGIFPWGKGGRCLGVTTLTPSSADCHEIWEPQPPGTLWVCPGLYRDCFTFENWRYVSYRTV